MMRLWRFAGVVWRSVRARVMAEPHDLLTLRLTLVLVGFYGGIGAFLAAPIRTVVGAMFVFPELLRHRAPWWILVSLTTAGNVAQWESMDNHRYLINYWLLACALATGTNASSYLRENARVLVGLVFAFAVFWKLAAGQYTDGSFWYYTHAADSRLQRLLALLSGRSLMDVSALSDAVDHLGTVGSVGDGLIIGGSDFTRMMARVVSWAALLLEGTVAVLALLGSSRWFRLRHLALMAFGLATYIVLPIVGFGFVLLVLGFAQCPDDDRLKLAYLFLLACIQLVAMPWQRLLVSVFGS